MKLIDLIYEYGDTHVQGKVDVVFWRDDMEYILFYGVNIDDEDLEWSDFADIPSFDFWFAEAEVERMYAVDNRLRIEINMEDYEGDEQFSEYLKENFI